MKRPSPALVVACTALFIALGGPATATQIVDRPAAKPKPKKVLKGPRGPRGPRGFRGPIGPAGAQGPKGETGPAGAPNPNAISAQNADRLDGLDSTEFARRGSPPWIEVRDDEFDYCGTNFLFHWQNYGGGYNTLAYSKDTFNRVYLKGLAGCPFSNGLGRIFILPAAYRPAARELLSTVSCCPSAQLAASRLDVTTAGEVIAMDGGATWFALDGISFRAAG